jgi:NDP-sugar pyrophosphorylase family protein
MKASDFFKFPNSLQPFAEHFPGDVAPWEWLKRIALALGSWRFAETTAPAGVKIEGPVYLHPTVELPAYATIIGPAWIGPGSRILPGAFLRPNVIAGAGCVLGNSCEYKNCLLMDDVQTAHFNYVGDSILGNRAHLGAGAVCANLRLDRQNIIVRGPDIAIDTGLRKFGAIVGDGAEVGCNAVLNPGALLGPRSVVMPAIAFGGWLPPATIARVRQAVSLVPRLD